MPTAVQFTSKAVYVVALAGFLFYIGISGDDTPIAAYIALYAVGVGYGVYHAVFLVRLLCGQGGTNTAYLPDHPLRRWFRRRSESVNLLPPLILS